MVKSWGWDLDPGLTISKQLGMGLGVGIEMGMEGTASPR